MTVPAQPDLVVTVTAFARALRIAGVAADRIRLTYCVQALALVDVIDAEAVYWAMRLTLCAEPDDMARFDRLFDIWFRFGVDTSPHAPLETPDTGALQAIRSTPTTAASAGSVDEGFLAVAASGAEALRHRDVAGLSEDERDEVNRMIVLLGSRSARVRTVRRHRGGHGGIDTGRTIRAILKDGELGRLLYDRRRDKPRRLVFLLDVSGSMAPYADVLLRFAHAAVRVAPSSTEVFTVSTHLTRITRQLRLRDPDLALRAAGLAVPDWRGGTRLGESIRAFLDLWGQRGSARHAVVVIASDGWERGDAELLAEQMTRLTRFARRIIWINPHRGKTGFAPSTAGMVAALPAIDDLVAGHSFEALRRVAEMVDGHR